VLVQLSVLSSRDDPNVVHNPAAAAPYSCVQCGEQCIRTIDTTEFVDYEEAL
jgi:hypothetical protein